ncbi:MAG: S4 domain-containing protein [Clostridiales bacterium]
MNKIKIILCKFNRLAWLIIQEARYMKDYIKFDWEYIVDEVEKQRRYCHGCSKKVVFYNSNLKRKNANGKNITEYDIFKCHKGHTWNKKSAEYKSYNLINDKSEDYNEHLKNTNYIMKDVVKKDISKINLNDLIEKEIKNLIIYMRDINVSIRLDKLLANYLDSLSRNKIQQLIKMGLIKINHNNIKINYIVKKKDLILISLECVV